MLYEVLLPVVRVALRWYYRSVSTTGLQRIPRDGPIFLAVNHPNALVDAMVVGAVAPRRVGFTAKATIFAWANPDCARRMHWARWPNTKPSGVDDATAARITIERAAGDVDPWTKAVRYETRGELVSGDTPVLAAIWMNDDARAAWGRARFAGQLRWRDAAAGVSAEVRGTLAGVDLQTTVAAALAQRLSGAATLEMAPLSIVEGRLQRWSGAITASNAVQARSRRLQLRCSASACRAATVV